MTAATRDGYRGEGSRGGLPEKANPEQMPTYQRAGARQAQREQSVQRLRGKQNGPCAGEDAKSGGLGPLGEGTQDSFSRASFYLHKRRAPQLGSLWL